MKLVKSFLAIALSVVLAGAVQAATVTYSFIVKPGNTFDLKASVSAGDNGGLSGYGIDLVNATVTAHASPTTSFANSTTPPGSGPAGFSFARSANGAAFAAGFQDISNSGVIPVYGMGQEASSFAAKTIAPLAPATSPEWTAPLLLASGTYTGVIDANTPISAVFNTAGPNATANVFVQASGIVVKAPEALNYQIVAIPEPATAVMGGLSLLGLGTFRRRRTA